MISTNVYRNILEGIPDKPRITLENYLLDLVSDRDGKESSLYINGAEDFIQEIWSEIVQNNWRKINVRKFIPEKLGVSYGMIYKYKNGKKAISIQKLYELLLLWQEYCNESDKSVSKKWSFIFESNPIFSTHSKHQKTVLPGYITPKLSYLLGWICGDGHLKECHNYLVKISEKSTNQLEYILKPLFKDLFGIEVPIFRRFKGGYAIQVGSKPIFRFLTQVLKIQVGKIPHFIWDVDKVNKRYFLTGLFDAEGYVCPLYLHSTIAITQSNLEFLNKVVRLFREIDISFIGPYLTKSKFGNSYFIQIRKKKEILKFSNQIGSCHVDKSQKLQSLVREIEKKWNS